MLGTNALGAIPAVVADGILTPSSGAAEDSAADHCCPTHDGGTLSEPPATPTQGRRNCFMRPNQYKLQYF